VDTVSPHPKKINKKKKKRKKRIFAIVTPFDPVLTLPCSYKWGFYCISLYLCLINKGLPRHLKVTLLPSGISSSLISILASARTSADALIELTNSPTKVFAAYAPTTAPPKIYKIIF
jgi:hypothetical protein